MVYYILCLRIQPSSPTYHQWLVQPVSSRESTRGPQLRDMVQKQPKTCHRSHADAGSMGPSALDRKNGIESGCVRSCDFVRLPQCASCCQHGHPKLDSAAGETPFCRRCERLRSPVEVAQRPWLARLSLSNSRMGRQHPSTYTLGISTEWWPFLSAL